MEGHEDKNNPNNTKNLNKQFRYLEILLKKDVDILKILPQIYYKNTMWIY